MQPYLKILVLKPNSRVVPMCLNYIRMYFILTEIYMVLGESFIRARRSSRARLLILIGILTIPISVLAASPIMLYQYPVYAQATTASVSIVQGSSSPTSQNHTTHHH
jgi:hypothetical protein